jgi:hypothetical protein
MGSPPNNRRPVPWQRSSPYIHPLLFVIPSVPGFPTSPLSPATTYVVLPRENHMPLTEAATLDRKSGGAEGSAVPRTLPGYVFLPRNLLRFRVDALHEPSSVGVRPVRMLGF